VSLPFANASAGLSIWLQRVANGRINPTNAKKPPSLVYGVDDHPPITITISNAVQQVCVIAINLVYPLVVFRAAGASTSVTSDLLAVGMIVLAFGTFLQLFRLGPVGSGYMCPSTFTATYFAPSLLAAKVGGLPLVFGMTLFSGVFESCIAPVLNRLRGIFPPEISGLVIFMIGWSAGIAGLRMLLGAGAPSVDQVEWSIAALTLMVMAACNIWGTGLVRMTSALIGIVVGYIVAGFLDLLTARNFRP
jgi:xanthine permease XanP